MTLLKIPIIGRRTHAETSRTYGSKTAPVNLRMQGSGIQNAITIISVALFSPKGSTICIEEPENSLHPKAQKNLIDILITIAKSQDKQIILTTHSDHIALALFDALGKGKMKGEELGVYSFSFKQNSSRIEIEEIKEFEESLVKSFDGDDDLFKMFSEAIRKAGAY